MNGLSIAELYAIRDAKDLDQLRRRLRAALWQVTLNTISLDTLIDLAEAASDWDIVRAGQFAREALERLNKND